jgi:hypothetical protein
MVKASGPVRVLPSPPEVPLVLVVEPLLAPLPLAPLPLEAPLVDELETEMETELLLAPVPELAAMTPLLELAPLVVLSEELVDALVPMVSEPLLVLADDGEEEVPLLVVEAVVPPDPEPVLSVLESEAELAELEELEPPEPEQPASAVASKRRGRRVSNMEMFPMGFDGLRPR